MKEKVWTVIGGMGMTILLAGACAMDSECLTVPTVMILGGILLCRLSARILYRDEI